MYAYFGESIVNGIARFIKDVLLSFGSWMWSFIKEFFVWIFDKLLALINTGLDACGITPHISWAADVFQNLNYFFPLTETLIAIGVFLGIWGTLFAIKIILKLIPSVY